MSDDQCLSLKKNGERCLNYSMKGFRYCRVHWKQSEVDIPGEKCCICLEEGPLFTLNCNHYLHLDCISNMTNNECPLCRNKIENIPVILQEKIIVNGENYKREREQEEAEEIIRSLRGSEDPCFIARTEMMYSLLFLQEYIPDFILPNEIEIIISPEQPHPPLGFYFLRIVNELYQKSFELVKDEELEEDEETISREMKVINVKTSYI